MATSNTFILNGITVNEVVVDEELASDDLKNQRLAVCSTCDQKEGDGCKQCSCLLVTRTAFTESFCPIGKW